MLPAGLQCDTELSLTMATSQCLFQELSFTVVLALRPGTGYGVQEAQGPCVPREVSVAFSQVPLDPDQSKHGH